MPVEIACPSCQQRLRVHDEHLGGRVVCPVCQAVLPAPATTGSTAFSIERAATEPFRPVRPRGRRGMPDRLALLVKPPAICLIVLGGLVALVHLVYGVLLIGGVVDANPGNRKLNLQEQSWVRTAQGFGTCFPLMGSAVIIVGGVKMLQREYRGWAIAASILAMIPCTASLGFVAGIPLGIWCLVTLLNPEVAAAFKRSCPTDENLSEW